MQVAKIIELNKNLRITIILLSVAFQISYIIKLTKSNILTNMLKKKVALIPHCLHTKNCLNNINWLHNFMCRKRKLNLKKCLEISQILILIQPIFVHQSYDLNMHN